MKLRRRQYLVGMSGVANVSSRQTNSTARPRAHRPERITQTDVHPTFGPRLRTSIAAVTAPARLQLPTQSIPSQAALGVGCLGRRRRPRRPASMRPGARDGRRRATTTAAMTRRMSCPQNRARQPRNWITGEPSVTPRTGPPAATRDHHPSALTRSSRSKSCRIKAMEAVPVAAPCTPSRARAKMQHAHGGRRRREHGAHHGPAQPEQVEPPVAEQVARLAEERRGDAEGQERAGRDPGQDREVGVELGPDGGQRHHEDREGDVEGEQSGQERGEGPPAVAGAALGPPATRDAAGRASSGPTDASAPLAPSAAPPGSAFGSSRRSGRSGGRVLHRGDPILGPVAGRGPRRRETVSRSGGTTSSDPARGHGSGWGSGA